MYQAIIRDRLLDNVKMTRMCNTEKEAREEGEKKIIRLCNIYNISVNDDRFIIDCIEIK
jgi:hypothetical protein